MARCRSALPAALLAALLLARAAAAAEEARPAGEEPFAFRVFDVRTLLEPLRHFRSPALLLADFGEPVPEGGLFPGDALGESAFLPEDQLLDLALTYTRAEEWSEREPMLSIRRGRLYARLPAPAMARLVRLLASLERKALGCLSLSFTLLPLSDAAPEGAPALLRPEQADRLLADAEKRGARPVRFCVSSRSGQRVLVAEGAEQSFVADYDAETAPGVSLAYPCLSVMQTGTSFLCRAVLDPMGRSVQLTLGFSRILPQKEGPVEQRQTPAGTLQTPALRYARSETTSVLPLDRRLLLRLPGAQRPAPAESPGGEAAGALLLVRVDLLPPAQEEGGGEAK